jgi:membrane protease subunit (stomatin/prohibitin family)
VLADQWREYFYCEAFGSDVLVSKGQKRVNEKRSSNTKASDNIITNGSIVAVNDGQFMMIVEQGKVVDFTAESGEYVYDKSTEPSLFYGGFGKGILESLKIIGRRFTFGGDTAKDQRVYFFNTKEILGNKYGTANPVPFRIVDRNVGLDIDIGIRCYGEYSYKFVDPILFYKNICGNVETDYRRDEIESQLKSELMTALQPAFARISEMGLRYSALPGHAKEIANALNLELSADWRELRGIEIA